MTNEQGIGGSGIAAAHIKHRFAEKVLGTAGIDLEDWTDEVDESLEPDSRSLSKFKVSMKTEVERDRKKTANVVAKLPGRNPHAGTLIVGAHYDHLGRGEHGSLAPSKVGEIHNGADDNASGTAAPGRAGSCDVRTGTAGAGRRVHCFFGRGVGAIGFGPLGGQPRRTPWIKFKP